MAKIEKKKASKKLKVNFKDVEVRLLIPEGEYHAEVAGIEQKEGNSADYLNWKFKIKEGKSKANGQSAFYMTSLAPQALWNLRNLLETLGVETPDSEFELDVASYIGLELMITIEHETYEGKQQARVVGFTMLEEAAETDDAEEEEEEAEEEEEETSEEDDSDTDEEEVEEEESEEEAEDEPEEEEEEEEKPKPGKKPKVTKLTAEEVKDMDQDELTELVKKHKLKIKDGLPPKKRRASIMDALEKADLLG